MMQLRYPFVFSRGRSAVVRRAVSVSLAALMTAGGIVALSGCGADSDDNDPYAYVSTAAPYAGKDYTTRATLADGTRGTIVARVLADGTAQGTFTPDEASASRAAKSRLIITTPFLSGTFNTQTGEINIGGSYTVNGQTYNLSINGVLPVPPSTSGGSLTYSINGQSFTSTWNVGATNPSANPSPGVTPTPGGGTPNPLPSPSTGPGSGAIGGTHNLVFTNIDSNATLTPLPTSAIAGARQNSAAGAAVSISVVESNVGSNAGRVLTAVALDSTTSNVGAGPIAVRDIYDFSSAGIARSISFSYVETQVAGSIARYFVAKSGTVEVVSSTPTQVTLRLTSVRFEPLTIYSGGSGAFTVSGDVTANVQ